MNLKHLPDEVIQVINGGIWSLYKIKHDTATYLLYTPASSPCCDRNKHPSKSYLLDADGKIFDSVAVDIKDVEIVEVVNSIKWNDEEKQKLYDSFTLKIGM